MPDTELLQMIENFINDRRPCVDSGYAPVHKGDVHKLSEIFHAIIEAKWDADVDGDHPINIILVDRTKYEPMHFWNVPYSHKCETEEDNQRVLDALLTNVNIATRGLETWSRIQRVYIGAFREGGGGRG